MIVEGFFTDYMSVGTNDLVCEIISGQSCSSRKKEISEADWLKGLKAWERYSW
jgi:hypothetical protein